MLGADGTSVRVRVIDRIEGVFVGADGRLRATYRVLLAWPVLWFISGTLALATGSALGLIPVGATLPTRMLVTGLLQAVFFGAFLLGWARVVDRRSPANYGLSLDPSWWLDLLVGFVAVMVGHAVWYAIGGALGQIEVSLSLSGPTGSLPYGLAAVLVALGVNIWVQETVFTGVTIKNGAEGLASRGLDPTRAVVIAWVIAVVLFAVKHRPSEPERVLSLLLALGVFALLYVHTGELALSIGVHFGVNAAGQSLFALPAMTGGSPTVFRVVDSLPGLLGSLSGGRIPQVLVAYVLLVGWLRWRDGEVSVRTAIARWDRSDHG